MIQLLAATVLFFVVYATKSPPYLGEHDALPSPYPIFFVGKACPPCPPRDLRHCIGAMPLPLTSPIIKLPFELTASTFGRLMMIDRRKVRQLNLTLLKQSFHTRHLFNTIWSTPYTSTFLHVYISYIVIQSMYTYSHLPSAAKFSHQDSAP